MNPTAQADLSGKKTEGSLWPWALLALAVCLVAISSQSLWIDEAFMASKASQPTLAGWWHMMPRGNGSDLQMPFYMIYMWAFAKIFGLGEWTLRAANIPWFVAGVVAFITAFPKRQRFAAAAVTLLCPFAWFYLDEARPYAMQIGVSLVVLAAIYRLSGETTLEPRREQYWVAAFLLASIVLCGTSLLGTIWTAAAFLSLFFLFPLRRLMQLIRSHLLACLLSTVVLAALAGYYIWTIKLGTRGLQPGGDSGGNAAITAVKSAAHFRQGFAGGTELQNLAFVLYELLGFSGFGPGRLEIRTAGLSAFRHFAPQLVLFALMLCPILVLSISSVLRRISRKKTLALATIALLPMFSLMVAGYFLGFRILGRHCAPLVPVLLLVLNLGLFAACSSGRAIFKILAGAFLALSLFSCLSLRFAQRHKKDDYRDAAQVANSALSRGQKVWWSAADDGATYYHVPFAAGPEEKGGALLVLNPTPESLSALPAPDVVITSKPDLYDNQQAIWQYVRKNTYTEIATFPAFTVWQRQPAQNRRTAEFH